MEKITEGDFLNSVNLNIGIIHRVCNIYFTNSADRQDACQEILYQLWKSHKGFSGASKFSTWMYKVAFNTAIGMIKNKKRESPKEEISEYHLHNIADTNPADKTERINLLYKAIHTLSSIDKAIAILYLEENSYEEMAIITGLSKTNISVRLVRIRKELKEKLKTLA